MTYHRVIPRDLFNEANLLKCLGQLYLELEPYAPIARLEHRNETSFFEVAQDAADGSLLVFNVQLRIHGRAFFPFRPLNSREAYPLYLDDDTPIFTAEGKLSPEMISLLTPKGT